jgi:hypothetical protein
MLSKSELRFLESPESFDPDYARVLRCRITAKQTKLQKDLDVLNSSQLSVTENCNVTELSKHQKSANQALNKEKWWAEPDSDRRPLARKANVLTRLDDRPTWWLTIEIASVNIRIMFSLGRHGMFGS